MWQERSIYMRLPSEAKALQQQPPRSPNLDPHGRALNPEEGINED